MKSTRGGVPRRPLAMPLVPCRPPRVKFVPRNASSSCATAESSPRGVYREKAFCWAQNTVVPAWGCTDGRSLGGPPGDVVPTRGVYRQAALDLVHVESSPRVGVYRLTSDII